MRDDFILHELERDESPASAALFGALAAEYFAGTRAGVGPVSTPHAPAAIAERYDEPLPESGRPLAEVVERLRRDVVADSNRLMHPMYMGHQVSAPLPAAVWAEVVTSALNQSVAVSEMSPAITPMEHRVVRWMTGLVGWGEGSGGTLTSGGTEATFTALLAARSAAVPDVWTNGVGARPPTVVCGEHAHYAVSRAVGEMGLGLRSLHLVPSRDYAMDVAALERTLDALAAAGTPVMAVVATAGSTATGSFDDLDAIGQLCERRGLWLHVDGAHGASALLSDAHRHRLRGIERARSLAWDPHKMMLLPLAAGMVLVRDERDLAGAFAQQAPYLFHGAGGEQKVWDQGVRSFLCSRRADVLKLWVALQRYGRAGIGALYDRLCDTTRVLYEEIGRRRDFVALHEPQSNILCFRWVGDSSLADTELDALNRGLRERYNRSGAGWITATDLGGRRVLRVTVMNPRTTREHVVRLLDGLGAEAWGRV
ncbi:MAG TPA: pyridoxal-dependent decarboxylase [Gemmatimonadaceae bacterium]|nr:pyridoxal-dependent decarboxylase [Gemmatimonadaceae bacterium]